MEEKIIIKSESEDIGKIRKIIWLVGMGLALAFSPIRFAGGGGFNAIPELLIVITIPFLIIGQLFYASMSKVSLTVTDKRVYGTAAFGKRVELPLDSVSAVGTGAFKSIAITSASGAIKFGMVRNRDEIHSAISKLLVDRQSKPAAATTIKQEIPQSNAEELKKYKELLDSGVISQEEFDAKKKQLLGL